jgi:hypothetical protein
VRAALRVHLILFNLDLPLRSQRPRSHVSMSTDNQQPTTQTDPRQSSEPARSPLKPLLIIMGILLAVLIFGALDR